MELQPRLTPSIDSPIRGHDCHGAGYYGAPRGNRNHQGIDPICDGGTEIFACSAGEVTKIGFPYSQGEPKPEWSDDEKEKFLNQKALRYVQVTDCDGVNVRYMYVQPTVGLDDIVIAGYPIGIAQGLCHIYPGIIDHIHFEVRVGNAPINPHDYLKGLSDESV